MLISKENQMIINSYYADNFFGITRKTSQGGVGGLMTTAPAS